MFRPLRATNGLQVFTFLTKMAFWEFLRSVQSGFSAHLFDTGFLFLRLDPACLCGPAGAGFDPASVSLVSQRYQFLQFAPGFCPVGFPGAVISHRDYELAVRGHFSPGELFQFSERIWRQAQGINIYSHLHGSFDLVDILTPRPRGSKKVLLDSMIWDLK